MQRRHLSSRYSCLRDSSLTTMLDTILTVGMGEGTMSRLQRAGEGLFNTSISL